MKVKEASHRKALIQRRFWNPVYDRLSGAYDAVDWFTGGYTQTLRMRVLDHLPPTPVRLLEIGVGTGRLHAELAHRYDMAGLDLAQGMVRRTQRRLAHRGLRSSLTAGSVNAIPYPNASFDAVLSTFAFSAFVDAECALDEMVRVTRLGGAVIIVDAGEAQNRNPMAHLLALTWEAMGDFMRDEVPLLQARGLSTHREDYGPWDCVHITIGTKPD